MESDEDLFLKRIDLSAVIDRALTAFGSVAPKPNWP